jgi:WD40 repeat protein
LELTDPVIPLGQSVQVPLANTLSTAQSALTIPPPTEPISPGKSQPSRRGVSRRTVIIGLAGTASLAAIGGSVWWFLFPHQTFSTSHETLYTYRGHSLGVNALVWSPDGTRIASASVDKTVQVWDATTGRHVLTYRGHSSPVNTIAWSGARIASGNDDVQVWDAATGNNAFIYLGYSRGVGVYALTWSPDGTLIASGGYDRAVQVWKAADGTRLINHTGHTDYVLAVAWSPDGMYIASGGHDKTVRVWDGTSRNPNPIFTYNDHSEGVSALAWSPDSKRIASGAYDKTVRVWDATTGKNQIVYQGHTSEVYAVAWFGKRIVSASTDKTAQIWDASNGRHIFTYQGHTGEIYAVAWSPDGTRIASGGQDGIVQVWQA